MGACYLYGQTGGGGEKIEALSGTIAPEAARENALWVQTETPVTDHVFSPVQPGSAAEGTVWLRTYGEGVNFILDKKQKLRFHLDAAYQYVGGAWRSVDISVYTGTGWEQIVSSRIYLYNRGDQCADLTGGWMVYSHYPEIVNIALGETSIMISMVNENDPNHSWNGVVVRSTNKIYIPDTYTKLCARYNFRANGGGGVDFCLGTQHGDFAFNHLTSANTHLSSGSVGDVTVQVDVSGYVNQQTQYIYMDMAQTVGEILEVWLER